MYEIKGDFGLQRQDMPRHCPLCAKTDSSCLSSSPVTVVGAGNRLVSCDRIGGRVLSQIAGRYGAEIELCESATNGLDLLDIIRCQDLLVIVDACLEDGPPGSVTVSEPNPEIMIRPNTSIHQISAMDALMIGQYLYPERMPRRLLLITVNTKGLDESEEEVACEQAIQVLDHELAAWRSMKEGLGEEESHGEQ
jgi:hydrogenase maturation protease